MQQFLPLEVIRIHPQICGKNGFGFVRFKRTNVEVEILRHAKNSKGQCGKLFFLEVFFHKSMVGWKPFIARKAVDIFRGQVVVSWEETPKVPPTL